MLERSDLKQLLIFVLIIAVTIIIAHFASILINRRVAKKNNVLLQDPTRLKFFAHVSTAIIYIIGFSSAIGRINFLEPVATSLLAGAGLITVAVSFASQNALSNIISGLFIVLFKPFGVNDRLKIRDNIIGVVEDITLRHTILRDGENKRIIIPNALMNNEVVVNFDFIEQNIKKSVDILLHHDSNIRNAKMLIRDIITQHPKFIKRRGSDINLSPEQAVPINITNVGEKGINMQLIITGRNILESNEIAFALLERLICEMPAVDAYFVRQDSVVKAVNNTEQKSEMGQDEKIDTFENLSDSIDNEVNSINVAGESDTGGSVQNSGKL